MSSMGTSSLTNCVWPSINQLLISPWPAPTLPIGPPHLAVVVVADFPIPPILVAASPLTNNASIVGVGVVEALIILPLGPLAKFALSLDTLP